MVEGSSMIGIPLVIVVSERDMPGIEPGSLGWHTSDLINEPPEVRHRNELRNKYTKRQQKNTLPTT
jgi:hypothetical protein